MKILRIDNNLGYFRDKEGSFITIDKVTKVDLLRLSDLTLAEDVEFDEYDEETIKNQAHQIIYKHIFEKLNNLRDRKKDFTDESDRLYLTEYDKYREEPSQQGAEGDVVTSDS